MNGLALDLQYLSKVYLGKPSVVALKDISLQVPYGSIFGLIGANGAGKSTLVKALLSILRPTECRGTLLGAPIGEKSILSRVGYLPEHARFPEYLTGRQIVEYSAGLCGLSRKAVARRVGSLLDQVGMSAEAVKPFFALFERHEAAHRFGASIGE
jgi:ABC-2 type transport system ATP-binding protein